MWATGSANHSSRHSRPAAVDREHGPLGAGTARFAAVAGDEAVPGESLHCPVDEGAPDGEDPPERAVAPQLAGEGKRVGVVLGEQAEHRPLPQRSSLQHPPDFSSD